MIVSFVFPTYNRVRELKAALMAVIIQTDGDWEIQVVIDGQEYEDQIVRMVEELDDRRIITRTLSRRYNDWGHTGRELGKSLSRGEYIVMSGDDNYYVPTFVEELRKAAIGKPAMIYWDMVHSHYGYQYFKCSPGFNQIDIGAFATRNDFAQKVKLTSDYAADGLYIEEFKRSFPSELILKINKVLYVHN